MKKNNAGLGIDLIEIDRIRASIERLGDHFIDKIFTDKEKSYCRKFKDPVPSFAGRFAAKEAVAKALGTGFGEHLAFHDIEVLNDENGTPFIELSDKAKERFQNPHILISISHCQCHANAVAILK